MTHCDKIITTFFFVFHKIWEIYETQNMVHCYVVFIEKKTSKEVIEKKNKDEKLKSHDYFMPNAEV